MMRRTRRRQRNPSERGGRACRRCRRMCSVGLAVHCVRESAATASSALRRRLQLLLHECSSRCGSGLQSCPMPRCVRYESRADPACRLRNQEDELPRSLACAHSSALTCSSPTADFRCAATLPADPSFVDQRACYGHGCARARGIRSLTPAAPPWLARVALPLASRLLLHPFLRMLCASCRAHRCLQTTKRAQWLTIRMESWRSTRPRWRRK